MALKKEVSSTEKLLDVIRSKKTSDEFVKIPGSPPSEKKSRPSFLEALHPRKAVSIGIDIGYLQLRLIKVIQSSDNQWKLLAHSVVPLKADAPRGAPEFANFLKLELDKFCGPTRRFNLWANMSSARVEVASIRIPKVAKKQIENAVYWTAKKTMSFNEKESVFDFEIGGEVVESGVTKLTAMVYAAPRKEVQEIQRLFEDIGCPLDGLTIAPFGFQNLFTTNWMPSFDQAVATLYIGRDWSRIDIFSKGNLVMTRGIRAGINSMVRELMEGHNESIKSALSEESRIEGSESGNFAENAYMKIEDARELLFGLSPDSPSSEEINARFGLDEKAILERINPALERLVRQVDRTFQYYTVTLGNEKISFIYVSTSMNVYKPLVDYIGDDLGIKRDVLDPLEPGNPLVDEITSNLSVSDRVSFGPALGVALSDLSRTPNLLFTYKDKDKQSNIAKGSRAIFVASAAILLVCVIVLFTLVNAADEKKAVIAEFEQQLKQGVLVDENVVPVFVSKIKRDRKHVKEYSERYLGMAAIREISLLTPSNIRLLHVTARMGTISAKNREKNEGSITIEGVVSGGIDSLEASLVEYILKLESSPMFIQAKISKSNMESFENVELLRFTLNVKFIKSMI